MQEKMKICAVICELNPLHSGHQALFTYAKERFPGLVCVLSGNFVQRGEPALLDKWARTRLALESGADLVLELPLPWAMAGAERFAAGGVALARALGCVDTLVFGSEEADIRPLWQLAEALLSPGFSRALGQVDSTLPFAQRRQRAAALLVGEETAALLEKPNCILGVEYLKAMLSQGGGLEAETFLRMGAGHDVPDAQGPLLSASHARALLRQGADVTGRLPQATLSLWEEQGAQGKCPASLERLEVAVLCTLRSLSIEDFARLPDVSEGLENRLYRAARQAGSLEEFYSLVKSKRYSHARVRRLALSAFLGLSKEQPALPPYLRVLGMTSTGQEILKRAKPALPLAARPGDFQKLGGEALALFEQEARADDLYALSLPAPAPCGRDYTQGILKLGF